MSGRTLPHIACTVGAYLHFAIIIFMHNDSLYRVSFKCLIQDEQGRVLAVKERGRSSWDLPGGGIEHGETIKDSIRRELKEETGYEGGFAYSVLTVDDPLKLVSRDVWQFKVVIRVRPDTMDFGVGEDADEVAFIDPGDLKESEHESERRVHRYVTLSGSTHGTN